MMMVTYVLEIIVAVASMVYYAISDKSEWLIFVGIMVLIIMFQQLICEMRNPIDDEWISVQDELPPDPDEYTEYNVVLAGKTVTTLAYCGNGIWRNGQTQVPWVVTHWRELPDPPKKAGRH